MIFIVSSNVEKADPATRKLIRSHVMRGKGQKRGRSTNWAAMTGRIKTAPITLGEIIQPYTPLVPRRVGSDLSFVEFADDIERALVVHIAKFSTVAMRVIFPLMVATGSHIDNKESLYPMVSDAAFLHITAFAVEGFYDRILHHRRKGINPEAMLHFQKGLKILRERLVAEDEEIKLSDSTISVVLKLASTAHFDGDSQASKQHMKGVRKMVDLRGGLDVFREKKLLREVFRCDLSIALLNELNPVFFRQPSEPMTEYPEKLLSASDVQLGSEGHIELIRSIDDDLATAWRVMRKFCLLVNLGTQVQQFISPEIIYETMASVIYRLLHMSFSDGSIEGIIRLGLLTFSHHVFLQWQDIKPHYCHFLTTYQSCVMGFRGTNEISSQLMLWLLMNGAISLFNVSDEAWLKECLQEHVDKCRVRTWKEMQGILKSFMWIGLLDDERGKQNFELLSI